MLQSAGMSPEETTTEFGDVYKRQAISRLTMLVLQMQKTSS